MKLIDVNPHSCHSVCATSPTGMDGVCFANSTSKISSEFSKINARKPEYRVFEVLRVIASGSGGFLSFESLKGICTESGVKYQTILKYLKRCSGHGWVTRFEYGYRWVSEEVLYGELVGKVRNGNSKSRLGYFPISIDVDELLPYLGKGVAAFRELLAKKRDILGEGKKQQQIIQSTKKIIEKISSGKKVFKRGVDPHDGTPYRVEVKLGDAKRVLWYYTENSVGPNGATASGRPEFKGNQPTSSRTQCLTNCRILSCKFADGEAAYTLKDGNTTTIWSKRPVSKEDLVLVNKFKDQKIPVDFDPSTWYKTEVVESCLSQSSMSRLNSMSTATNGRYVRKLAQQPDLLVVKQILVVSKYDPILTSELNDLSAPQKYNLPVKGKYYSVRMSKSKLFKLKKQGVIVDWSNISGSNKEMYDAKEFTTLVFQHRYYSISKSKVQGTFKTGREAELSKNDSAQAHLQI